MKTKRQGLTLKAYGITASLLHVPSESPDIVYRLKVANQARATTALSVKTYPENFERRRSEANEFYRPIKTYVNAYLGEMGEGGSLHQPQTFKPESTLTCVFRIVTDVTPSKKKKLLFLAAIISLFIHN